MANISNSSLPNNTSEPSSTSKVEELPPPVDYTFRVICLVIHTIYFGVVATNKELRKVSLIHMHHINFIGWLTGLHYCIWIAWTQPETGNVEANIILCQVSNVFWAVSKYARCYSILVLAAYRLVAVFRVNLFKKIVKNKRLYLLCIVIVWIISGIIFCIAKFPSQERPGSIICYDGSAPNIIDSIIYYIITSSLGYVLPTSLIVVAYIFIRRRLNTLGGKLVTKDKKSLEAENSSVGNTVTVATIAFKNNNNNSNNNGDRNREPILAAAVASNVPRSSIANALKRNVSVAPASIVYSVDRKESTAQQHQQRTSFATNTVVPTRRESNMNHRNESLLTSQSATAGGSLSLAKRRKEKKLAKQFIVINIFEIGSCLFLVLLSSSNVITIFSTKYYFARQLFRIGNLICQSIIPVISIVYSPVYSKILNSVKALFKFN